MKQDFLFYDKDYFIMMLIDEISDLLLKVIVFFYSYLHVIIDKIAK